MVEKKVKEIGPNTSSENNLNTPKKGKKKLFIVTAVQIKSK